MFFFPFISVDLPSTPLATEGPALQHLGKTRPKPARLQQGTRRRTQRPSPNAATAIAVPEQATPTEKPPETQPKPVKAKPLLPKPKSNDEPVVLTKYEAKPDEPVKPVEPVREEKEEEVSETEHHSEPEDDEVGREEAMKRKAKHKEVKAKLADLTMEDLFKPKPTKTYDLEPEESEEEEEPQRSKVTEDTEAKDEDSEREEETVSEPSPVSKDPQSDSEPSELGGAKSSELDLEFDQILAGMSTTDEAAEIRSEVKLSDVQEGKTTPAEEKKDKGESSEDKKLAESADVKPVGVVAVSESPKGSPKRSPKPRRSELGVATER